VTLAGGVGVDGVVTGAGVVGLIEVTAMLSMGCPAVLQFATSAGNSLRLSIYGNGITVQSATPCAANCEMSEIATSQPRQVLYAFATSGVHRTATPAVSDDYVQL
jgi:tetrahydromethanopterin S-methyltransferase subunit D